MSPEEIRLLYDYDAWANHRVLDSCVALTDEQLTRSLGSSFSSIRDTLAHILGGEWIWLERWLGRSPGALITADQFPNLARLRERWAEVESDQLRFVRSLGSPDLEKTLEYKDTRGAPYASRMREMLQHVVNHSSYHRGQITTLLRQLGATPVSTDMIRFYRERAAGKSA